MARSTFKDLSDAELMILSCNVNGDKATVVLRAGDGSTITAEPSTTEGGTIGPIVRAYPEAGTSDDPA